MPVSSSQDTVIKHDLMAEVSVAFQMPHSRGMLYVRRDLMPKLCFTGRSNLEIFLGDRPIITM